MVEGRLVARATHRGRTKCRRSDSGRTWGRILPRIATRPPLPGCPDTKRSLSQSSCPNGGGWDGRGELGGFGREGGWVGGGGGDGGNAGGDGGGGEAGGLAKL